MVNLCSEEDGVQTADGRQQMVGMEVVEVYGVERTVDSVEDNPATWQCWH